MIINIVTFQRTRNAKWESGVCLGEDKLIIDNQCRAVELPVYDVRDENSFLCIDATPLLEASDKLIKIRETVQVERDIIKKNFRL